MFSLQSQEESLRWYMSIYFEVLEYFEVVQRESIKDVVSFLGGQTRDYCWQNDRPKWPKGLPSVSCEVCLSVRLSVRLFVSGAINEPVSGAVGDTVGDTSEVIAIRNDIRNDIDIYDTVIRNDRTNDRTMERILCRVIRVTRSIIL
jgi:hypothetical protein